MYTSSSYEPRTEYSRVMDYEEEYGTTGNSSVPVYGYFSIETF